MRRRLFILRNPKADRGSSTAEWVIVTRASRYAGGLLLSREANITDIIACRTGAIRTNRKGSTERGQSRSDLA